MEPNLCRLVVVIVSWLVGSIPIGWLVLWKKYGINLLKEGKGTIGATNVERVLAGIIGITRAKKVGKQIEVADMLKGCVPFAVARYLLHFDHDTLYLSFVGAGLILGHCYSAYLRLKGGKGVATTMGIAAGTCWYTAGFCYLVWFVAKKLLAKRTTEATGVASVASAILMGGLNIWIIHDLNLRIFFGAAVLHIIFTHRTNLTSFFQERKGRVA